jgi:hypothetical protein
VAISQKTKKNVLDWLIAERVDWAGRLGEEHFIDRVVNLDEIPSTDDRYETARQDLWQHRENNNDWDNEWVYSYGPIGLRDGDDKVLIGFLAEMLHPIVRPDSVEARRIAAELNDILRPDRVELFEASSLGTRPVWAARTIASDATSPAPGESGQDLSSIWEPGYLRLFLSHVSAHKVAVSALKRALDLSGVSAFVAHEDIEPTLEWQVEIERALASMDALAALITPDFHASNWTDQEVGIALGRPTLVIAVRLPANPYGFMGKLQAMRGNLARPTELADALVELLLRRPSTSARMRSGLVLAFERAPTYATSKKLIGRLESISGFTSSELGMLSTAVRDNPQVSDSLGVPARVSQLVSKVQESLE